MEWPKEKVLLLIEMFRKRPVLWNPKSLDYKDRNKRNEALAEISKHMGEEKEEVERKIRNIRCHYSRELKKQKDKKCGRRGYKSRWFAFESLSFLKDKTQTRKRRDTENSEGNDDSEEQEMIEAAEKAMGSSLHLPTKRSKSEEFFDNDAYADMKNIYTQSTTDEFSLFGEQLAIKLRNLNTHHARVVVQHIINTTLCEAQLGKYDFPPPSVKQPYQSLTHARESPYILACSSQSTCSPPEVDNSF